MRWFEREPDLCEEFGMDNPLCWVVERGLPLVPAIHPVMLLPPPYCSCCKEKIAMGDSFICNHCGGHICDQDAYTCRECWVVNCHNCYWRQGIGGLCDRCESYRCDEHLRECNICEDHFCSNCMDDHGCEDAAIHPYMVSGSGCRWSVGDMFEQLPRYRYHDLGIIASVGRDEEGRCEYYFLWDDKSRLLNDWKNYGPELWDERYKMESHGIRVYPGLIIPTSIESESSIGAFEYLGRVHPTTAIHPWHSTSRGPEFHIGDEVRYKTCADCEWKTGYIVSSRHSLHAFVYEIVEYQGLGALFGDSAWVPAKWIRRRTGP